MIQLGKLKTKINTVFMEEVLKFLYLLRLNRTPKTIWQLAIIEKAINISGYNKTMPLICWWLYRVVSKLSPCSLLYLVLIIFWALPKTVAVWSLHKACGSELSPKVIKMIGCSHKILFGFWNCLHLLDVY